MSWGISTELTLIARLKRIDLVGWPRQVGNPSRKERLRRCDDVEGLPEQLDLAALSDETGRKHVIDAPPGGCGRRMCDVLGKHLIRCLDQDVYVLGLEHEIRIKPFHHVIKARDGRAAFVARLGRSGSSTTPSSAKSGAIFSPSGVAAKSVSRSDFASFIG